MSDQDVTDREGQESVPGQTPRPPLETLLWRALKLRCPRCGEGKLYSGVVRMPDRCPECNFLINRAPGYYLGSTYVNYGLTAVSMTFVFLFCRLVLQIPTRQIIWPLFAYCIVFPILVFRHARAIWLAFDCQFDSSVLED